MADKKQKEQLTRNLKDVMPLFKKEEPVIYLNNEKTLIVTDIHGNADSLDFILEFAEKKKIESYVFLGDYVDKGPDSIRVLNTLFELKCNRPKNTFLLRGNHETEDVNSFYEFRAALKNDMEIHSAANDVFENMPIAVVLNKSIFCVHGGISGKKNETVSKISKQNSFYYMWNDPDDETGLNPSPRGGKIRSFGPDVTKNFLKKNKLKLIIRGHSTLETGLKFWFDHTLISLYSSLPDPDPNVKAAVAIVDGSKIEFNFYKKDKKNGLVWDEKTMQFAVSSETDKKKKK